MLQGLRRWWHSLGGQPRANPVQANDGNPVASGAARDCELGLRLLKESKPAEALACFANALAASPLLAEAHHCRGLALRALGKHDEALASFQRALEIEPDHVPALTHQGMACFDLGRREDAADCFSLALVFDPSCVTAHIGLAKLYALQKRDSEAIEHFEQAVHLDPQSAAPFIGLSSLWQSLGELDRALASLQQAAVLAPAIAEVQHNLGVLCLKLERPQEAATHLERATALRAEFPEAHFNLGNALLACNDIDGAMDSYLRAIALRPDYAEAHHALGTVYRFRGDLDKAIMACQSALSFKPDYAEAQLDLGVVQYGRGRTHDAIACYQRALSLKTDLPAAHLNLALAWLTLGDFERGWAGYDWRFEQTAKDNRVAKRPFAYPEWQGENLTGKSILVWAEQGIGDQLVFASLFDEIIRDAGRCVIGCAGKLVALFARSFPAANVIDLADSQHVVFQQSFDYHVAAGSIARWRRPSLASFPRRSVTLVPDAQRVAHWRARLGALGPGLKVGFCWRSSNTKGERALSCTRLQQWGPIFGVPGVHFVCLQYDECAAELAAAKAAFGAPLNAFPEVDLFGDLDEAAALTAALDLVISAPTAASILSAALGVPTWQMSYGPDWQTHGTERNPWLPAIVRFQRTWTQDWGEIIEEVARRLIERVRADAITASARDAAPTAASHAGMRGD